MPKYLACEHDIVMSASELLKQVKALSARERTKFLRKVAEMKAPAADRSKHPARQVIWPDVEARARRNSGGRILPNLVLTEREDAAF